MLLNDRDQIRAMLLAHEDLWEHAVTIMERPFPMTTKAVLMLALATTMLRRSITPSDATSIAVELVSIMEEAQEGAGRLAERIALLVDPPKD